MIGAIVGDIVGSRFEFYNIKTKEFELFAPSSQFTDDSVMSLAIAQAVLDSEADYSRLSELAVKSMRALGEIYPDCSYGLRFRDWLRSETPAPYNSFGNGAPMRVSACGFAAKSIEEAVSLSFKVTEVTHNHPEGIKGAEATAVCVFLARTGATIPDLREYVDKRYYPMNFTLDGIRDSYYFNETSQDTVPQAIMAFLESRNFVDAIRNAISIGGDSDTLAAITGAIADAYYGVPHKIRQRALSYLDERLLKILTEFDKAFPPRPNRSKV